MGKNECKDEVRMNEIIRSERMFKCDGVRTKTMVRRENKNALKVGFENMNIKVRGNTFSR